MGMYDYIGKNQIKTFYDAGVFSDELNGGSLNVWTRGGELRAFNIGDDVPWKTSIYNYGKDFIIFDVLNNVWDPKSKEKCVHVIKYGKVAASYALSEIPSDLPMFKVIGKYGSALNIKSPSDFKAMVDDRIKADEMNRQEEDKCGYLNLYKTVQRSEDETERWEALSKIDAIRAEINEKCYGWYEDKWTPSEDHSECNFVGLMIHSLATNQIPPEKQEEILNMFKSDTQDNLEQLIDEYVEWQGDEVLFDRQKICEILRID